MVLDFTDFTRDPMLYNRGRKEGGWGEGGSWEGGGGKEGGRKGERGYRFGTVLLESMDYSPWIRKRMVVPALLFLPLSMAIMNLSSSLLTLSHDGSHTFSRPM